MNNQDKKTGLLSVMNPAPKALPKTNRLKTEASTAEIRSLKEEGEKHDPIAGKGLREEKRQPATVYLPAHYKTSLKLLAAKEGNSLNDYYVEAISDFLIKHENRIPKI